MILGIIIGTFSFRKEQIVDEKVKVDTVYVTDLPVIETNYVDSTKITIDDFTPLTDTTVQVPKMYKIYQTPDVTIRVSGYNPTVDWVKFNKTTITKLRQPKRVLYVESGLLFSNRYNPNVMVGYDRNYNKLTLSGKIGYDFSLKTPVVGVSLKFNIKQW